MDATTITMATGERFTVQASYDDAQAAVAAKAQLGRMHEFTLIDGGRASVSAAGVTAIVEASTTRGEIGFR